MNIDELKTTPVDLIKANDAVNNKAIKKTEHDDFVKKVNTINGTYTRNLVEKINYGTKVSENKKKITDHDYNDKYKTTQELNKSMSKSFAARLKQANCKFSN